MLVALWPSAAVALICLAAALMFKAILPASLPPMAVLLILALPLASVWYVALRLTGHPLSAELHHVANGLKARLA